MITLIRPCWQKHPKIWIYGPSILGLFYKRIKCKAGRRSYRRNKRKVSVWYSSQATQLSNPWWMGARQRVLKYSCLSVSFTPVVFTIQLVSASMMYQSTLTGSHWATAVAKCFEYHLWSSFFNFIHVNRFGDDSMRHRSPVWSS